MIFRKDDVSLVDVTSYLICIIHNLKARKPPIPPPPQRIYLHNETIEIMKMLRH